MRTIMNSHDSHIAAKPEILADEIMKKMWDEELLGMGDTDELLYTAEEKIAFS